MLCHTRKEDHHLKTAIVASIIALAAGAQAQQQTFSVTGILSGRTVRATGQPSWLTGGFGRLDYGGPAAGQSRTVSQAVGQIGADWKPSRFFDVHVDGLARTQPSGYRGRSSGLVQAFADLRLPIGSTDEIQLRGGQFFLPPSRENREALWSSPYTISLAAINNWMGQGVRPVGLDLRWKRGIYFTIDPNDFSNNDTL